VRARIAAGLRAFLSPLPIDESLSMPNWEGWPFGRDLYVSDLYSLIQQVPGVKHVLDVRLATRPVVPTREQRRLGQDTADSGAADQPLSPVFGRAVSVRPDMLLCSLEHQIRMVEL